MENKLLQIQTELKAPKDLYNKFANYKYRSCESILEALKPLLKSYNCLLTITDEMVMLGNRFYVKAAVCLQDIEAKATYSATAYAREEEVKKGMDSSQITGAASSYARKYALNGLFLIDDTKDSDHTNTGESKQETKTEPKPGHEAAKLQPSEKKVRGTITDHKESGMFHNYTVNGLDLSTKQSKIIDDMNLYYEGKDNLEIIYNEVAWAKGVNRYIVAVRPLGDNGTVPF